MDSELKRILGKINTNPPAATADDLEKAANYYYEKYQTSESERDKSIYIGQAAYHGFWSVKRGNRNIESIKLFIKFHELDAATPNPESTTRENMEFLKNILRKTESQT